MLENININSNVCDAFDFNNIDKRFICEKKFYDLGDKDYEKLLLEKENEDKKVNFNKLKNIEILATSNKIELSINELLFLRYNDRLNTKNHTAYPNYWFFENHIEFQKTLELFFENGYLRFAKPKEKLEFLSKIELQILLEGFNLNKTGVKKVLIQRINENLPETFLEEEICFDIFFLTEKGNILISKNEHIFYCYDKKIRIPLEIVELASKINPAFDKYNIVIFALKEYFKNLMVTKDYSEAGRVLSSISKIYLEIKNLEFSFSYCIGAIFFDLFDDELEISKWTEERKKIIVEFPEVKPSHFITPAKLVDFWIFKEKYNIPNDIIEHYINEVKNLIPIEIPGKKYKERLKELFESKNQIILEESDFDDEDDE